MGNNQTQEKAEHEGNELLREYNEFKNGKKRLSKAVSKSIYISQHCPFYFLSHPLFEISKVFFPMDFL